jgi:hypothetical protein
MEMEQMIARLMAIKSGKGNGQEMRTIRGLNRNQPRQGGRQSKANENLYTNHSRKDGQPS